MYRSFSLANRFSAMTVVIGSLTCCISFADEDVLRTSELSSLAVRSERDQVVRDLLKDLNMVPAGILGDIKKHEIIKSLAAYRAPEAASILVDDVTFVIRNIGIPEAHPLQAHTAAHALTMIGSPAYDAIFRRLVTPATAEELKLFAYVLSWHDGRVDSAFGLFLLQRARNSHHVVERVDCLDRLNAIITAPSFGKTEDWPSTLPVR